MLVFFSHDPTPHPFRITINSGFPFCSLLLMVVDSPNPHTHVQWRSFLFTSIPGQMNLIYVWHHPSSFTSHVLLFRGKPFSVPYSPRLLIVIGFSSYGSCHKFSSSMKCQCKSQSSFSVSPPGCPIAPNTPCTDWFSYANNKHGSEIEQRKEKKAPSSKMCNVDNIGSHTGYK